MVSPLSPPLLLPAEPAGSSSMPSGSTKATGTVTPPQGGEQLPDDTPPNRGTACIAEYLTVDIIDAVEDGVLEDIKNTKECEIETMLRAMLRTIAYKTDDSTENKEWAATCLQRCLDAATSFVNDRNNTYTKELRSGLREYCKGVREVKRYPGMVPALNAIICQFRSDLHQEALPAELRILGGELDAMFKVNDPAVINPELSRVPNSLKPDIIQLNWKTSRKLNGYENAVDDFEATIVVANKNRRTMDGRLQWGDLLSTFEFKKRKMLKEDDIHERYESERLTHGNTLPPLKPSSSGYEDDSPSTPSSGIVTPQISGRSSPMKSGRRAGIAPLSPLTSTRQTRSSTAKCSAFPTTASAPPTASWSPITDSSSPITESATGSSRSRYATGKRKHGSNQVASESSDSKRVRTTPRSLHPVVQSTIYAAERLSVGAWIKCAVSVIVSDDELYVTLHDRQSPLAARGFNFIKHLPHFVVLVLILQRLQNRQWDTLAFLPALDSKEGTTCRFKLEGQEATIRIDGRVFEFNTTEASTLYVLNGRGTTGVPVTEVKADGTRVGPARFLKISWPESIRQQENEIIKRIGELSREYPTIADHTPNLLAFETFTDHSTSHIRTLLGFESTEKDFSRVLCCGVYEMLEPITNLKGLTFWKAYWEIIATHYTLWQGGVEHGDISISNLMYRDKDGVPKGVLNDYDLARLTIDGNREGDRANDRTGTIPFMAIDLLSRKARQGKVRHLYRHDLESFAWVLFWITSCYDEGKERSSLPNSFATWNTSASVTYEKKLAFLLGHSFEPLKSWESIDGTFWLMKMFWLNDYTARINASRLDALNQQGSLRKDKGLLPDNEQGEGEKNIELLQDLIYFLEKSHWNYILPEDVRTIPSLGFTGLADPNNPLYFHV